MDYERARATAARLIGANGRAMTLVRRTQLVAGKPWDPAAGGAEPEDQSFDVRGVVLNVKRSRDGSSSDDSASEGLSLSSRRKVLMAADVDVTPKVGDILVFGGDEWNVTGSTPLEPSGLILMHTVEVEK